MTTPRIALGLNIDHVATLRQARRERVPDPVQAALVAEQAGADSITLHLREDRRHIQDADVRTLRGLLTTHMNLEMAVSAEMLRIAAEVRPADVCLVPERRAELTTEGGLDVVAESTRIGEACAELKRAGIRVSLFIDPEPRQIEASAAVGAPVIELHTGAYAGAAGAAGGPRRTAGAPRGRGASGPGPRTHRARWPRAQLRERAAGGSPAGRRRAEHRARDRSARGVRRTERGGTRDEGADAGGARMIYGIGVDVLEAERITRTLARFGARFTEHLLLPQEAAQMHLTRRPARFLAMRFAAKEAIVKAMGTGFAHGMWIRDVGVVQNAWGKPEVIFSERGDALRRKLGIGEGHVTLTDEKGLVVAVAVLMRAP